MNSDKKTIYILDDDISFRQCSLSDENNNLQHGDCTNFNEREENWKTHYYCNQYGIHLQCTKHPEIELDIEHQPYGGTNLTCPKCNKITRIESFDDLLKKCLKKLNYFKLKDCDLIRIDDYYYPQVKKKEKIESDYWINLDVKQDKDHDTMIVLYVGKKGSTDKTQFFIKPEKLQLTSDHKDLDPATILAKIEVTLKDRKITQEYDEKDK